MERRMKVRIFCGNKCIHGNIVKTKGDKATFESKKYFKPKTKIIVASSNVKFAGIILSVLDKHTKYETDIKIYEMLN
jgi:hypothetical protein